MVLLIINSLNTTYGRSFQSTTIQHNNKNDKLLSTNSNSRRINSQKTLLRSNQKKILQQQEANANNPISTMPSDANEKYNTKFDHGVKNNNVPSSVQDPTQKNPVTEPRRVFPNNIRPLNSAVEDTAAPVTPTKDLPVFPPEEGPVSLRITRRDSTSITLAWDPPPGQR